VQGLSPTRDAAVIGSHIGSRPDLVRIDHNGHSKRGVCELGVDPDWRATIPNYQWLAVTNNSKPRSGLAGGGLADVEQLDVEPEIHTVPDSRKSSFVKPRDGLWRPSSKDSQSQKIVQRDDRIKMSH
jgi:hypothetical protein